MNFISTRIGALASIGIFATTLLGAVAASVNAQDQAAAPTPEMILEQSTETDLEAEPTVKFVARPVVQPLPEQARGEENGGEPASLDSLIASMDAGEALSREMQCLAQAIYFEARGEPLHGQLAVARVIINRATSTQFPDDYCSVVTQPAQFSFVRGERLPEPNPTSAAWHRAKAIARIAHRDLWESEAGDSLYFHAKHVRPRWANSLQTRATIDRHIFYR